MDDLTGPATQDEEPGLMPWWAGAERLELPLDRPRGPTAPGRVRAHGFTVKGKIRESLRKLKDTANTSPFVVMLAAFQLQMSIYSGQDDFVVGATDLLSAPGVVFPVRAKLSGDPVFADFLGLVAEAVSTAGKYTIHMGSLAGPDPMTPTVIDQLLAASLQVMLVFGQSLIGQAAQIDWVPLELEHAAAGLDITLFVAEGPDGGLLIRLVSDGDVFDSATVERFAGHFGNLLEAIARDPGAPLSRLLILDERERERLLVKLNATNVPFMREACIHELVEIQAAARPEQVAVSYEGGRLTYRELNDRANHLALKLRERCAGQGTLVAICAERGPEMVVGLLAILKAGAAYVPLDPEHPADRLAFVAEDAGARILLASRELLARLPSYDPDTFEPLPSIEVPVDGPVVNPIAAVGPRDLAYVLYTSGSTGTPKGVQIEHQSVVNFLEHMKSVISMGPQDTVAQEATFGFDVFVFECWGPLTVGATLAVINKNSLLSPETLRDALLAHEVTVLRLPAALLALYLGQEPGLVSGLKSVCYGGEMVDRSAMDALMAGNLAPRQLIHWYGPTETTVISTLFSVPREPAPGRTMPIGRPIANTRVYVVDRYENPLPIGIPGELWIGGAGIARGYHNLPELTADRFVRDPFSKVPEARVYRTGDIVRWLPDGELEFLRRKDRQLKIRGNRVEPGEVEAAVLNHADVSACVVVAEESPDGDRYLAAYCVLREDARDPTREELHELCASALPTYMIPTRFLVLNAFPVTATGKVDRQVLRDYKQARLLWDGEKRREGDPLEDIIGEIWRRILGVAEVGPDDDFLTLGGHSLLAARVVHAIRLETGVRISLRDFMAARTVAATAQRVALARGTNCEG